MLLDVIFVRLAFFEFIFKIFEIRSALFVCAINIACIVCDRSLISTPTVLLHLSFISVYNLYVVAPTYV